MSDETEEQHEARCQEVYKDILLHRELMDCGTMLERLAGVGWDAALLYDDNGNWGMATSGSGSVSMEPADWKGYYFVEAKSWKSTPREAIVFAVEERRRE